VHRELCIREILDGLSWKRVRVPLGLAKEKIKLGIRLCGAAHRRGKTGWWGGRMRQVGGCSHRNNWRCKSMGDKGGCPIGRGKSSLHPTQFEKRTERWLASYQGKVDPCSTEMPRSGIIYSSTLDENFRS